MTTPLRKMYPSFPYRVTLTLIAAFVVAAMATFSAPAIAQSPEDAPGSTTGPVETVSLLELYNQGGLLMHFILMCSIAVISISGFCFLRINRRRLLPVRMISSLTRQMAEKSVTEAYHDTEKSNSLLAGAMSAALEKADFEEPKYNRDAMEKAAAERLNHEETRLNFWINYLNVFATVTPMIGLLGTVTGMIQAFNQLAAGRSEPSDLAGGIGQAMVTTAGGLIVGIPAMFAFFFFRNNLQSIVTDTEAAVLRLLDYFVASEVEDPEPETAPAEEEALTAESIAG